MSWKSAARRDPAGFYRWRAEGGEVGIFMSEALFTEMEESLGVQTNLPPATSPPTRSSRR